MRAIDRRRGFEKLMARRKTELLANQLPEEETKAHKRCSYWSERRLEASSSWATLILFLRFETVHARDRRTPFIRTPNELEHHPNRSTAVATENPDD